MSSIRGCHAGLLAPRRQIVFVHVAIQVLETVQVAVCGCIIACHVDTACVVDVQTHEVMSGIGLFEEVAKARDIAIGRRDYGRLRHPHVTASLVKVAKMV